MITAGIDCGSQNTKSAVVKDGRVVAIALVPTEFDADLAANRAYEEALKKAGVAKEEVSKLVITGVGREIVKWGDTEINEVGAAARGARYAVPKTDTVIDMGADSCRVIRLNEDGSVMKYEVNDKCASGAGTFIEAMARALQIKTEEMGEFSLRHTKELATNAQCVVFAESEVISLIHAKETREDIAYGVHMGIANRIASMIRRVGLTDNFTMIGGPGFNKGLVSCMSKVFGRDIIVPENNQYMSAVGAALFAAENKQTEDKTMAEIEKVEYWRWTESNWKNPEIADWHGSLITAGVDIGSTSTQAVILADGVPYAYSNMRTGSSSPDSAIQAINWAMKDTGMTLEDLTYTIGTGYGRVNVPFSNKTVTEITCHAKGANYIYGPTVRTILDMGGQDCKAIHCDEKGSVTSFMMNDKCAAGTGRGMEVIANLLAVSVEDIGELSFQVDEEPAPVSSTCVIFAKSEATKLMRSGWTKEKVLAAYCHAMALRVVRLLERNGMELDFAITGGIAKNVGVVRRIENIMGIKALAPTMDTQIAGALGAALLGKELIEKKRAKEG